MDSIFRRYIVIVVTLTFLQQSDYAYMYYKQSCRVKNRNMTSHNLAVQNVCKKYLESIVDGIAS
jgi:hypothetical protein